MTKTLRTPDGKFNGSIGDGKTRIPTSTISPSVKPTVFRTGKEGVMDRVQAAWDTTPEGYLSLLSQIEDAEAGLEWAKGLDLNYAKTWHGDLEALLSRKALADQKREKQAKIDRTGEGKAVLEEGIRYNTSLLENPEGQSEETLEQAAHKLPILWKRFEAAFPTDLG